MPENQQPKCMSCGKPADYGFHRCPDCLDKMTARLLRQREEPGCMAFRIAGA